MTTILDSGKHSAEIEHSNLGKTFLVSAAPIFNESNDCLRYCEEALVLSKATEKEIDFLLTDVVMPGMNGRELAEALMPARPNMKVIFVSGYTDNVIAYHGILKPGVFFINKPLIPSVLAMKVREVLDNSWNSSQ